MFGLLDGRVELCLIFHEHTENTMFEAYFLKNGVVKFSSFLITRSVQLQPTPKQPRFRHPKLDFSFFAPYHQPMADIEFPISQGFMMQRVVI